MIEGKSILAVIPARGGSRGLPGKNIKSFAGLPLIAWSIKAAQRSQYIDKVIVSTDDATIADTAVNHGCEVPFMRPASLAQDNTSSAEVMLDVLTKLKGYQFIVMLQPTSPLRTSVDIDSCIEHSAQNEGMSVVTVAPLSKPPHWMFYRAPQGGRLVPLLPEIPLVQRRQDAEDLFVLNGAVYVSDVELFQKKRGFLHADTLSFVMPADRSPDIDSEVDFALAEHLFTRSMNRGENL